MIDINLYDPRTIPAGFILRVHKAGNLGFTKYAQQVMNIAEHKSVGIGTNKHDKEDTNLYMLLYSTVRDYAYPIRMNGGYYYAQTKLLFDFLKIPYSKGNVAFRVTKQEYTSSIVCYRMEFIDKEVKDEKTQ